MEDLFEHEMEIARQIQASFLPDELPQLPGWEIAAGFQPARHVAGDFYDVFPLLQGRRLGLVVGDVCGKGVGAALYMALFRTLLRAFAQQHHPLRWMDALAGDDLAGSDGASRRAFPSLGATALKSAVDLTNDYIANTHASADMFATLFFGVLDPASGALVYVNAGHELPVVVNPAGIKARLATTGPAVGMLPDISFDTCEAQIEPGDTVLVFTDGVTDALDPAEDRFGFERLRALLMRPSASAAELLDRVQAGVQAHMASAQQFDDITLLAIRRAEEE